MTDEDIVKAMINEDKTNLVAQADKIKDGLQNFVIMTAVKDRLLGEIKPLIEQTIKFNKISEKNDKHVRKMIQTLELTQTEQRR